MDEEQGLASPLAGSIRGIRRSVSSSVFTGRSVLPQQPDPQTTKLLNQNSLTLTTVSQQLENISLNLSTLNFSLSTVKDNLAVSDTLERQREAAKRNRERILAEQGLREGKESDIEKKIQFALQTPVRRIAATTQGVLQRLVDFFLILAGGWLTNTLISMINATADGNVDLLKSLQRKLATGLLVIGGTLTAITFGLSKIFSLTALLASRAFRFGFNNILRRPFQTIINLLRTRLGRVFGLGVGRGGGIGASLASLPVIGGIYVFISDQFKKLAARFGFKPKTQFGVPGGQIGPTPPPAGRMGGFLGPFRKIFGGVRSSLAFGTLFDIFVNGENPIDALKNNLGGVLIAAIAAPFIVALVAKLGLPILAAGVVKFIATSIFFGIGKSLFNRFRIFGGKNQQVKNEDEPESIVQRSEQVAFGENNIVSTDNTLVAQTSDVSENITPVNAKRENNLVETISNFEEGGTTIVNIPTDDSGQTQETQLASAGGGVEEKSSVSIPFIGFDNDNIHTQYAVTTFGAFA